MNNYLIIVEIRHHLIIMLKYRLIILLYCWLIILISSLFHNKFWFLIQTRNERLLMLFSKMWILKININNNNTFILMTAILTNLLCNSKLQVSIKMYLDKWYSNVQSPYDVVLVQMDWILDCLNPKSWRLLLIPRFWSMFVSVTN